MHLLLKRAGDACLRRKVRLMADGVVVAQGSLKPLVKVQFLVGQPFMGGMVEAGGNGHRLYRVG